MNDLFPQCIVNLIRAYCPAVWNALISLLGNDQFFSCCDCTLTYDQKEDNFLFLGQSKAIILGLEAILTYLFHHQNKFWTALNVNLQKIVDDGFYVQTLKVIYKQKLEICDHFCQDIDCPWHEFLETIFGPLSPTENPNSDLMRLCN